MTFDILTFKKEINKLLDVNITSEEVMNDFLANISILFDQIDEFLMNKYIDFQRETTNTQLQDDYSVSQQQIKPVYKKAKNQIEKKIYDSREYLTIDYQYFIERIENSLSLMNDENIQLLIDEDQLITNYFHSRSEMTANWKGENIPADDLIGFLYEDSRNDREKALKLLSNTYISKETTFHSLLDKMLQIRLEQANNVGLNNYRDYMFKKYERFHFSPNDCLNLAESIRKYVLPIVNEFHKEERRFND
ncbi:hypothetical protein WAK64_07455 [Bacillus spongiae]|uniref:M3 family oligoendopeptidase n=1 Tax=Bacillus spongiae TaxID=2683610 RepID=A0ABU8HC33_9BACI